MKVYYIGGSPCSGKSTVAEMVSKKFEFFYYKLDDRLDEHMKQANKNHKSRCKAYFGMTSEQIWMRKPEIQFDDEVNIYREIFEYALSDIGKLKVPVVIAEGAGFLPELMKLEDIRESEYICITPTRDFQIEKYSKREWVSYVLEGCTDKKAAFENWMERDAIFAKYASETAEKNGYKTILTDGMRDASDMLNMVEKAFGL
jgi:shikimate kinase